MTVWDATLANEARAVLHPGPAALPASADVVVVGAGAVGLATAYACRHLGRVVVIERDRVAAGPSGRAAGVLAPAMHPELPDAYASLRLHWEWDLGAEPLSLRLASSLVTGQARIHPLEWAVRLAGRLEGVCTGVTVTDVRDGRVATSHGDVECDAAVLAVGGDRWVKGHLVATAPMHRKLDAAIVSDVIVVQLPDGRLVAGGTIDEDDDTAEPDQRVVDRITRRLAELVPGAPPMEHAWCCFRPRGPMRVEQVSDRVWSAGGMFRTGMLMAPWVGERLAGLIAG